MKNPFASRDLPESTRRRVELAIAVAEERLLSTHVKYALQAIELTEDRLDFETALDIYSRLLRLDADDARVVDTQVLARLGEREAGRSGPATPSAITDEPSDTEEHRSFISQIRQRLRGRVQDDLRRLFELQAARAEVALLETHVDNAVNFVEILHEDIALTDGAELYLEALDVRDAIAEVVYYITLDRWSDRILGERKPREAAERAPMPGAGEGPEEGSEQQEGGQGRKQDLRTAGAEKQT